MNGYDCDKKYFIIRKIAHSIEQGEAELNRTTSIFKQMKYYYHRKGVV